MQVSVVDFFCGAGGFSEGFRQLGFKIIYGYDHWTPAVDTFNLNFNLHCEPKNILDFKNSIEEINKIPNTEVIIGSPPCVSFSSSNKSGKADKSLGVELTETFLQIIAIKKHQPNSILKAWFMENVVNSKRYLQTAYTFKDLGLTKWAQENRISPLKIAIDLYENSAIINSADYGAFQSRKRIIAGEIIKKHKLIIPLHIKGVNNKNKESNYNTIREIKQSFPSPFENKSSKLIKDIQYDLQLPLNKITDHFYDTGIYKVEWNVSKYLKTNHPFMGKMSFPEDESKPSRTITATKISNSRESIIYKAEIDRTGDGEYRSPTVREAAIIMGFPISYQFIGSEKTKWRLVGNAVCISVSRAFANTVLEELRLPKPNRLILNNEIKINDNQNLNTFSTRIFDKPPIRKKNARFRRHAIKDGNMTVSLSNYDIQSNLSTSEIWQTSIQYGTGKGFPIQKIENNFYVKIEHIIKSINGGDDFLDIMKNSFSKKIACGQILQEMYQQQKSIEPYCEPTEIVEHISDIINKVDVPNDLYSQHDIIIFKHKENVPIKQLFALYAINLISSLSCK